MSGRPVAAARPALRERRDRLWLPRQHGAWAMLALPLLLGVAVSRPSPWQLVLGGAAVAAYLALAASLAWARARFSAAFVWSIATYGTLASALGLALVASHPVLIAAGLVLVPAAVLTFEASRARRPRGLLEGLAQVAQALVLAPAAAWLGGVADPALLLRVTALAALALLSSVLVVRSAIRERGNARFAVASVLLHGAAIPGAWLLLGPAYAALAAGLTVRAVLVPVIERYRARRGRPLRPIQLGLIELAFSVAVVLVALAVPLR